MTTPYNYQKQGVRFIERHGGRAILGDEPGLGKTFQALLWAKNFLGPKDRVVVVCPANVKYTWEEEAKLHVNVRASVLETRTAPEGVPAGAGRLFVVNYDILFNPNNERRSWLKFLKRLKPKLVVIDECHMVSNYRAKRTRAVIQLCKGVPHVIAMSGTPLLNSPAELFTALHILDPEEFDSYFSFAFRYTKARRTPWGWQFKGGKNLEELHKKLKRKYLIRRRKADVLDELPAKTRTVVPVPIEDRKQYELAVNDFAGWLRQTDPQKAVRALRAAQLSRASALRGLILKLKFKSVKDWVGNFLKSSNRKLVLFSPLNRDMLLPLHTIFENQSVIVTGATPANRRQQLVSKFRDDKSVRVFFGNMFAAGVGMNGLQRASSDVAFAGLAWNHASHAQAEGRLDRIGQALPINIYYLVAKGTIEEDHCALIQDKQEVASALLDGGRANDADIDLFDRLIEVIKQKGAKK